MLRPNLDAFFDSEPLGTLLALSGDVRIEFDRRTDFTTERTSDTVVLRYVAKYEDKGRQRELPFRVVMRAESGPDSGDYSWLRVRRGGKGSSQHQKKTRGAFLARRSAW